MVREVEAALPRPESDAELASDAPVALREIATAYVDWLAHVKGVKRQSITLRRGRAAVPPRSRRCGRTRSRR